METAAFRTDGVMLMHGVEAIIAWSLVVAGTAIGATMVAVGMLEELPDIVRTAWNDLVHR